MQRLPRAVLCALLTHALSGPEAVAQDRPRPTESDRILWTTQWNHDGTRFAVGGEHALWIYDADSLEGRSLLPRYVSARSESADRTYMAVTHVAWHPSKDVLAVSSQGANVCGIYDIGSGKLIRLPPLTDNAGRGISWSPKADKVALASPDDGHLRIYNIDGTLLHDVPRYKEAKGLTGVAWCPTGDRIVTIGSRITLHDDAGKPLKQWMHRTEAEERDQLLLSVSWHPSGEFFVVGDYGTQLDDPVLQFWSADGVLMKSISLEGDTEIRNISWNSDGTRLATATSKLTIWNRDGTTEFRGESPDLLWGVSWHPTNDTVLTSDLVGRVTLWSDRAQPIRQIRRPDSSSEQRSP